MNKMDKDGVIRSVHENSDYTTQKPSRNYIPKILCVLAAFVLWIYVMQVESPEYEQEITSVPVELENAASLSEASGLSVYSGSGNRISLTVAGKKSIVSKLKAEDVSAYIDLSRVKEAGRHSLDVSVDLPDDVTLVDCEPSTVTVYVDEMDSISLPVSEKLVNFVLESPYELGEIAFEFDTVNVTGPKNRISNLAGAVVTINMEDRKSTFVTNSAITLVDKSGNLSDMNYLSMSASEMNVTVPIYLTKDVPVEVRFKYGLVDASHVKVTCEPSSFSLKGDAAKFSDGTSLIEKIEIDETAVIETPYTEIREVVVRDGLTASAESTSVKITVEYDSTVKTRQIAVSDIKVKGAPSDLKYEIADGNILVMLRGNASEIDSVKASDISATIDLEGFDSSSSGVITKNATVTVNAQDADSVFVLGTYPVKITINSNES